MSSLDEVLDQLYLDVVVAEGDDQVHQVEDRSLTSKKCLNAGPQDFDRFLKTSSDGYKIQKRSLDKNAFKACPLTYLWH